MKLTPVGVGAGNCMDRFGLHGVRTPLFLGHRLPYRGALLLLRKGTSDSMETCCSEMDGIEDLKEPGL